MTRRLPAALVALALSLGAAACSDDPTDAGDASSSSTTTAPAGATTTGSSTTVDPVASTTTAPVDDTSTTAAPAEPGPTTTTAAGGSVTTTSTPGAGTTPPSLPPASIGVPEEPPLNEAGEPITLDETALLACANDQFAWVSFQQGDTSVAATELAAAAQRAEVSAVPAVSEFADDLAGALDADDPLAVMQSFLDLCVANGFEY